MAIARRTRSRLFGLVVALIGLLLISGTPVATAAANTGGVLPPNAQPLGYSLRDMARKIAPFTSSANDPAYYPHTRLQVLYTSSFTPIFEPAGCEDPFTSPCGVTYTGTNDFSVPQGTQFYVPVQGLDDSDPVIGTFPAKGDAAAYFFDHGQAGAEDYQLILDGQATVLGPEYLVGPFGANRLYGGHSVYRTITLAAFVGALSTGKHTVRIVGQLAGEDFTSATGLSHYGLDFTYKVTVTA